MTELELLKEENRIFKEMIMRLKGKSDVTPGVRNVLIRTIMKIQDLEKNIDVNFFKNNEDQDNVKYKFKEDDKVKTSNKYCKYKIVNKYVKDDKKLYEIEVIEIDNEDQSLLGKTFNDVPEEIIKKC